MTVPTHLWICGKVVPLDGSELEHITLEKVAVALAYTNRFNGGFGPASLAAHSVRVADRLPPPLRLAGLWHDVGEIVTGDIAAPLKPMVRELTGLEMEWRLILAVHLLGEELGERTVELCGHHLVKECDAADYFERLPVLHERLEEMAVRVRQDNADDAAFTPLAQARRWYEAVRDEIARAKEAA